MVLTVVSVFMIDYGLFHDTFVMKKEGTERTHLSIRRTCIIVIRDMGKGGMK